jgi:hypothetical protein
MKFEDDFVLNLKIKETKSVLYMIEWVETTHFGGIEKIQKDTNVINKIRQ